MADRPSASKGAFCDIHGLTMSEKTVSIDDSMETPYSSGKRSRQDYENVSVTTQAATHGDGEHAEGWDPFYSVVATY